MFRPAVIHTPHPQLLQRIDPTGLQQLADNPIRLFQALLQQYYAPALLSEGHRRRTADNACADNDDIRFVVHAAPLFTVV